MKVKVLRLEWRVLHKEINKNVFFGNEIITISWIWQVNCVAIII